MNPLISQFGFEFRNWPTQPRGKTLNCENSLLISLESGAVHLGWNAGAACLLDRRDRIVLLTDPQAIWHAVVLAFADCVVERRDKCSVSMRLSQDSGVLEPVAHGLRAHAEGGRQTNQSLQFELSFGMRVEPGTQSWLWCQKFCGKLVRHTLFGGSYPPIDRLSAIQDSPVAQLRMAEFVGEREALSRRCVGLIHEKERTSPFRHACAGKMLR